jgi:hypothetical protein
LFWHNHTHSIRKTLLFQGKYLEVKEKVL